MEQGQEEKEKGISGIVAAFLNSLPLIPPLPHYCL